MLRLVSAPAPEQHGFRCEICGEPVGIRRRADHRRSAHAEILAVRQEIRRRTRTHRKPFLFPGMVLVVLGLLSFLPGLRWLTLVVLAGLYGLLVVWFVFEVHLWRRWPGIVLDLEVSCEVCDGKVPKGEFYRHMEGTHAQIYRLMKGFRWLLGPPHGWSRSI